MATGASIGYNKLSVQSFSGSPIAYNNVEEVRTVTGLGHTGTQVDVTNFDSPAGYREFIAGLKEGREFTVTCNWLHAVGTNTQQLSLIASANAGQNRNFKMTYTASSPMKVVSFNAAILGFTYLPDSSNPNTLEFQMKISGVLT